MHIVNASARLLFAFFWLFSSQLALAQTESAHTQKVQTQRAQTQKANETVSYEEKKRQTNDIAVTMVVSGISCTCARFAEDMRNVVNDLRPDGLRVLPVLGVGGLQNLNDVLFLKGIDMGVVDEDNARLLKKRDPQLYANIEQRVQYITKLYNSEFHVVARNEIKTYDDLRGKKVNFNLKDSHRANHFRRAEDRRRTFELRQRRGNQEAAERRDLGNDHSFRRASGGSGQTEKRGRGSFSGSGQAELAQSQPHSNFHRLPTRRPDARTLSGADPGRDDGADGREPRIAHCLRVAGKLPAL
jgi:hypothetical protein